MKKDKGQTTISKHYIKN